MERLDKRVFLILISWNKFQIVTHYGNVITIQSIIGQLMIDLKLKI